MQKVVLYTLLLIGGLVASQLFAFGNILVFAIHFFTLTCLASIMIHVGLEFWIDKSQLGSYGWDYFVAFTAATFPWIFCALYFVYAFPHNTSISPLDLWVDVLLLSRFASPTSAGILFAMLAAADLETSWVYKKARVLAIFDDLDTILILIPIKMLITGFNWESLLLLTLIAGLIYLAWRYMHAFNAPLNWHLILFYSFLITALCESVYHITDYLEGVSTLQIEVLLPAFVLGCILAYPETGIYTFLQQPSEKRAKWAIASFFMVCVGLSMPPMGGLFNGDIEMSWREILLHVSALTFLSNLGKMFLLFCYRKEATLVERVALSLGMCPRGEVGAGVIVVSLAMIRYIDKSLIIIAMLSLILNLILTGPIIMIIKKLLTRKEVTN